ncbi:outer membrane beta-barrel protein [Sorangium sp. So ce131]|uniref:outer membrane beta-barrel protein n=1 Tax=Sorangium sp. So ce131 TaxID=3133282 RepID=UPI003F623780
MRRCLTHALVAVAMTVPLSALAQENPNCPPGAWFCEEVEPPRDGAGEPPPAPAPEEDAPAEVLPPPPAPPAPPPRPRAGRRAQPPVVIYQTPSGPPPQVIVVTPGATPPPRVIVRRMAPPVPPAPPKKRWRRQWGVNLRMEGLMLGEEHGGAENAGMGGFGISLRYRPIPAFAFDLGADFLGGTDYNGHERTEVPLSLSGILFVNPRSRTQFYFTGGLHVAHADVEQTWSNAAAGEEFSPNAEYDYFGAHGGIGLEFRLSRRLALNIDALGFVRSRTDDGVVPEFRDPDTGRTTDTSGGGLFRGGLTVYW